MYHHIHEHPVPAFDGRKPFILNQYDSSDTLMSSEIAIGSAVMIMFCVKCEEHNSSLIGIKYNVKFYILGVVLLADSADNWMDGDDENVEHEHLGVLSDTESDVVVGEDNSVVV